MSASARTAIYWVRNDLRLSDNPALTAAAKEHQVVFVYVHCPGEEGQWVRGEASRWWLHHSLAAFGQSLQARYGAKLLIQSAPTAQVLLSLVKELGADALFFSKRYEPWARKQEETACERLSKVNIEIRAFDSSVLFAPDKIATQEGNPYKVYTPFWRKVSEQSSAPAAPLKAPAHIESLKEQPEGLKLDDLGLLPSKDWAEGIAQAWQPGEDGAIAQLNRFLQDGIEHYRDGRNRPDKEEVSCLSPHLHFGEISSRLIWHAVNRHADAHAGAGADCQTYLKELVWREFATHLLYHFPHCTDKPLRENFNRFPWSSDEKSLRAWQKGKTGFPIVDAGMRQLWKTGWMHNRVRMVVASFLVKDLTISWTEGAKWFWDTLVDADLANNTLGWQWCAGCGADAAPYFRVFNPVLQGEKFDPDGAYVRKWVPELKELPTRWIHAPWTAPPLVLEQAGVELGVTYPQPMVDHAVARQRALRALATLKDRNDR